MNKVMFCLTIILFLFVITSERVKDWVLSQSDFVFNLIITGGIIIFVSLICRSFGFI